MNVSSSDLHEENSLSSQLEVRRSRIDGKGLFAKRALPPRRKLGEYAGERILEKEARRRVRTQKKLLIVETGDGYAIDGSVGGNLFRYLNHSCTPNTYMRIFHGHIEFYTLRPISRGEELTCQYGETHHDGKLLCKCGSIHCKGLL